MASVYGKGDLVRVTGTFTDSDGVATDPTAVLFKYKPPTGATVTYIYLTDAELNKSATGIYYVDVSATESGVWWYEYSSTGTGQAVEEAYFEVRPSNVE
jgi:hypothetical protein